MKNQEWNGSAPEFVTALPDLVEERMVLRKQLKDLDTQIRHAVIKEIALGSSQAAIASILGVSRQRVAEIANVFG